VSVSRVPAEPTQRRWLELFALLLSSLAIWWQPLLVTLSLALHSDAYTHILLVLPLSVALIYADGRRYGSDLSRSGFGLALLVVGLILRLSAWKMERLVSTDQASVSMFGLVIWWLGSVLVCFGYGVFRRLLFPLGFLFLLIPLPEGILSRIIDFLQHGSAWATTILFRMAQVPVARDGVYLAIPGLRLEVAQECSSIRSSMMLLLTTLILAHLFLRSWWTKTLLALAVIPLSLAKNAVRIFTIAELVVRVDPSFMEGRLHRNGGVVFLTLSVGVVICLLWLLRKTESGTDAAIAA
jgi:exosortase